MTVTDSTISGNSAGYSGGGISSTTGNVTVTDSTISGNSAGCTAAASSAACVATDGDRQHDQRQLGRHGGGGIFWRCQRDGHRQHDQRQLGRLRRRHL